MKVIIKEFDKVFLDFSWKWLNDPEIKFLTNTPDFSKEQQKEWFNSLHDMKNYFIWGVEVDSIPIGICGLKKCTLVDCEYWGYIGEKQYWGKGIGKQIMVCLEQKAQELGKTSIWLRVIKQNVRAISLYKSQGYVIESETDTSFFMRKQL